MSENKVKLIAGMEIRERYIPVGWGVFIGISGTLFFLNPKEFDASGLFSYVVVNGIVGMLFFLLVFALLDPVYIAFRKLFAWLRKASSP